MPYIASMLAGSLPRSINSGALYCLDHFLGCVSHRFAIDDCQAGLRQALFAGDFGKVKVIARARLAANPRSVQACVLLARAQMAEGDYASAFGSLLKALGISPT